MYHYLSIDIQVIVLLIFHLIAARARLVQIEKIIIVRRTPIQPLTITSPMVGIIIPLVLLTAGEVTDMGEEAIKGEGVVTRVRKSLFLTKNFSNLSLLFLIEFQKSQSVISYSQHDSRFRSLHEIQEDWLNVKDRDIDYERFILIYNKYIVIIIVSLYNSKLFGKATTGIHFGKYEDIPIKITGTDPPTQIDEVSAYYKLQPACYLILFCKFVV